MKLRLLLVAAMISLATFLQAQQFEHYLSDDNATPREHQLDIKHMLLDVRFDPPNHQVMGTVTHTFSPIRKWVDTVFWDAPGIVIDKALIMRNGVASELEFTTNEHGVVTKFNPPLSWDTEYQVQFTYHTRPKRGIYFIGWEFTSIADPRNQTRQQIWTQGQGIDNRHWIPMYDNMNDKFITETIITFNEAYNVLSNGDLQEIKENGDRTKTWHYKMRHPHAGYLLMLAIDKYKVKRSTTSRGTDVQFWYYPEHPEKVDYTSMHTEKMIEFLEDETGFPYPWGGYSQVMVQDFIYGAMENTSATIFGDFFNVDEYSFNDRNYIGVNAHELTHQWFGDLVTARSGSGTWLQESFATYYAKLFMKELYGDDEYRWNMRGEVKRALEAGKSDNYPIVHTKAGTSRVYPKGSSVLHMLRYVLGDEEYKRVIKYYLEKHAFGNVETNDLEQAVQDVLGQPMDWFFNEWLYRGGEPHFDVRHAIHGSTFQLYVDQIHPMDLTIGAFKMPVNCGIYFSDGSKEERQVWVDEANEVFNFDFPKGKTVEYYLFDINSELIKQTTEHKSNDMLLKQFTNAAHMIDRYDALLALADADITWKRKSLLTSLEKETHYGIKGEIVKQLAKDPTSAKELMKCLKDEDVRVRRSLLTEVKNIADYKEFFISALKDKSYINIETALIKLMEQDQENAETYLKETEGVIGQAQNVRISWLGYKLIQMRKTVPEQLKDRNSQYYTYMNELTLYTSGLYEFRTRINAMHAIQKFNFLSAPAITNILDACLSSNKRLAGPAMEVLKWYNDQYELSIAIQKVYESISFSEEQRKTLRDAGIVR